jgi:hypothetical protein
MKGTVAFHTLLENVISLKSDRRGLPFKDNKENWENN